MQKIRFFTLVCWPGVLLLCAAASGCGLSDYQNKMDAQRARVAEFDETNRMLDDALEMPRLPQDEAQAAWPFEFFLRLPKGYTLNPKTPYSKNFSFFRWQGADPSTSIFIAAALLAELKKENYGEYERENFRSYVRDGIEDFYIKTYKQEKIDPNFFGNRYKLFLPNEKIKYESYEAKVLSPISGDTATVHYETIVYTDKENKRIKEFSEFRVFHHLQLGKQVAIVFQRPLRTPSAPFEATIEAKCLGTLDVGPEAISKRAQFRKK